MCDLPVVADAEWLQISVPVGDGVTAAEVIASGVVDLAIERAFEARSDG